MGEIEQVIIDVIMHVGEMGTDVARAALSGFQQSVTQTRNALASLSNQHANAFLSGQQFTSGLLGQTRAVQNFNSTVSSIGNTLLGAGRGVASFASSLVGGAGGVAGGGLSGALNSVMGILIGGPGFIAGGLMGVLVSIPGLITGAIGGIGNLVSGIAGTISNIIGGITSTIGSAVQTLTSIPALIAEAGITYAGIIDPANLAGQFEQTQLSFEAIYKSADKAKAAFSDIMQLAIKSPFTFGQLLPVSRFLASGGVPEERLKYYTEQIANAAIILRPETAQTSFTNIGRAFQQALNQRFFSAYQSRELRIAGVKAEEYLSREFAPELQTSGLDIQQAMEKRLIPARRAIRAIAEGIEQDFGGMVPRMAQTFLGTLSTVVDTFRYRFEASWGKGLIQGFEPFMRRFVAWFDQNGAIVERVNAGLERLGQMLSGWLADRAESIFGFFAGLFQSPEFINAPDALSALGSIGSQALNSLLDSLGPVGSALRWLGNEGFPILKRVAGEAWEQFRAFIENRAGPDNIFVKLQGALGDIYNFFVTNFPAVKEGITWMKDEGLPGLQHAALGAGDTLQNVYAGLRLASQNARADPVTMQQTALGFAALADAADRLNKGLKAIGDLFNIKVGGLSGSGGFLEFMAKLGSFGFHAIAIGVDAVAWSFQHLAEGLDALKNAVQGLSSIQAPDWLQNLLNQFGSFFRGGGGAGGGGGFDSGGGPTTPGGLGLGLGTTERGGSLSIAQFGDYLRQRGFSEDVIAAACGPIAAAGIAQAFGDVRDTPEKFLTQAGQYGWTTAGMGGGENFIRMLSGVAGIHSGFGNYQQAIEAISRGVPVAIDAPGARGHYFLAQGFNGGQFDVGESGKVFGGGGRNLSLAQMAALTGNSPDALRFIIPQGGGGGSIEQYIRMRAQALGIDPDTAVRVAMSEGGVTEGARPGDKGTSFGPFQLHYGNGLGDAFTSSTGLNARDPNNVYAGIDFALQQAARGGWGPFHGAARVGISNWQGIASEKGGGTSNTYHIGVNVSSSDLRGDTAALARRLAGEIAREIDHIRHNVVSAPGGL
jgi:hypothetical protein